MALYVLFHPNGSAVKSVIQTAVPPTNAVNVTGALTPAQLSGMMLVERPAAPAVSNVGSQYTIAACPIGTKIEIFDTIADEQFSTFETTAEGEDVVIDFPDAGAYLVTIVPPLPYMSAEFTVTVE